MDIPISGGGRDQVELHHRYRQAIQDTLALLSYVQRPQQGLAERLEHGHQGPTAAVKPALRRYVREPVAVVLKVTKDWARN